MFNVTRLVTFHPEATPDDRNAFAEAGAALAQLPNVLRYNVRPVGDYAVYGGDLACYLQFLDEEAFRAACNDPAWQAFEQTLATHDAVASTDGVTYRHELIGQREPGIRDCLHRTLLLAVRPGTPTAKIAEFEAEMREMADYLPAIRNWSFSRTLTSTGARAWTHVWEQEFRDIGGLMGPYMMHPIHFAHIDRWFDTESPDWIVDPRLCHSYWPIDESVIAP